MGTKHIDHGDKGPRPSADNISYRRRLAITCRRAADDAEERAWAFNRAGLLRAVAQELEAVEEERRREARKVLAVSK